MNKSDKLMLKRTCRLSGGILMALDQKREGTTSQGQLFKRVPHSKLNGIDAFIWTPAVISKVWTLMRLRSQLLGLVSKPKSEVEETWKSRCPWSPHGLALSRVAGSRSPPESLPGRRTLPTSPPPSSGVSVDRRSGSCCCIPRPGTTSKQLRPPSCHTPRPRSLPGHSDVQASGLHWTYFWQVKTICNHMVPKAFAVMP